MENFENSHTGNDHTYRTGSTNPPKSHRGLVAVLLILVIVLTSIVTLLGMMNIRLFRLLEEQNNQSVRFSEDKSETLEETDGVSVPQLGLTGQEIEGLYRSYQEWPQGLYICQVTPDGPAEQADIRPGDILVAMDGVPISCHEDFQEKATQLEPGNCLELTIFREEEELTVTLTVEE